MTRSCLLSLMGLAAAAWSGSALAQVPPALAAPGQVAIATYHGVGAQIYECKAGNDGKLSWTFREPIAALMLDGKTVGRHYAGPTWELTDGSAITAKATGNAPGATANDVAWLKLDVTSHRGKGLLSDISTVQRLNTRGGVMQGGCNQAGAMRSVPYSADYSFLSKDNQDLTPTIPRPAH